MRLAHHALALQLLLVSAHAVSAGFSQQDSPLRGQGVPSSNVSEGIYMSGFLDRLLAVDEQSYRFEAVIYLYITWYSVEDTAVWFSQNVKRNCDDSARGDSIAYCGDIRKVCQIYADTTGNATLRAELLRDFAPGGDAFLGVSIAAVCESFSANSTSQTTCDRPCSNNYATSECCDGIFIPDIQMTNIFQASQDYIHYYTVTPQYDAQKEAFGAWMWTSSIHAEYYSPMDFTQFPFDSQSLIIEFKYTHDPANLNTTSVLLPSAAGLLNLRPRANGDDSSGWHIQSVGMETYQPGDALGQLRGTLQPPNVNDPVPLFNTTEDAKGQRVVTGLEPIFNTRLNPGNNLLIRIDVKRYYKYYVVNVLIPIILSSVLGFSIFLVQSDDMEKRLGLLITLFLALTAVQFVISADLPNSSYILKSQALVLAGYALLIAIALEAWLVCHLGSLTERSLRLKRHASAYRKHRRRQAAAAAAKLHILPQTSPQRSPLGKARPQHSPADPGTDDDDEDLESLHSAPSVSGSLGQRSMSAPLPPAHVTPNGASDPSGGTGAATDTTPGVAQQLHPRPYSQVKWFLRPAREDPVYAEWLAQTVDHYSLIFLFVAYTITIIAILAS